MARLIDNGQLEIAIRRAAWAWLRRRIAARIAKSTVRQTIRELSVLSNRQLRDIGLLRADIHRAAASSQPPLQHTERSISAFLYVLYCAVLPPRWRKRGAPRSDVESGS